MPEQPPDPLLYEMKIPPDPNPNKQHEPEKSPSDENYNSSQSARDTNLAREDDKPQAGRGRERHSVDVTSVCVEDSHRQCGDSIGSPLSMEVE